MKKTTKVYVYVPYACHLMVPYSDLNISYKSFSHDKNYFNCRFYCCCGFHGRFYNWVRGADIRRFSNKVLYHFNYLE